MDAAPSLVSDSGSTLSISPRALPSPTIELPPLNGTDYCNSRKPGLPLLHFSSNVFLSEADSRGHSFSPRIHNDVKNHNLAALHIPVPKIAEQLASHRPQNPLQEVQYHILTTPSTPMLLPPLQSFGSPSDKQQVERDARMNLSSLLA